MSDLGITGLESWDAVQKYHDQKLAEKDAEIAQYQEIVTGLRERARAKDQLITKLCDGAFPPSVEFNISNGHV